MWNIKTSIRTIRLTMNEQLLLKPRQNEKKKEWARESDKYIYIKKIFCFFFYYNINFRFYLLHVFIFHSYSLRHCGFTVFCALLLLWICIWIGTVCGRLLCSHFNQCILISNKRTMYTTVMQSEHLCVHLWISCLTRTRNNNKNYQAYYFTKEDDKRGTCTWFTKEINWRSP